MSFKGGASGQVFSGSDEIIRDPPSSVVLLWPMELDGYHVCHRDD